MERMIRDGSGSNVNISTAERCISAFVGASLLLRGLPRDRAWITTLLGVDLFRRGATGHSYVYELLGVSTAPQENGAHTSVPYRQGIRIDESVTVNRPPEELYQFWRKVENLPQIMRHLISVSMRNETRSHWIAKAPAGEQIEWDAEIINDIPEELIGWRSLSDSEVDTAGSVRFKPLAGDRGTQVRVELQYLPPGGIMSAFVAKFFGEEPHQQIREDLRRFKQIMETGEIATTGKESQAGSVKVREQRAAKPPARVEAEPSRTAATG